MNGRITCRYCELTYVAHSACSARGWRDPCVPMPATLPAPPVDREAPTTVRCTLCSVPGVCEGCGGTGLCTTVVRGEQLAAPLRDGAKTKGKP